MTSRHRSKGKKLLISDEGYSDYSSSTDTDTTSSSELWGTTSAPSASTKGTGGNSFRNEDIEDASHPPVDPALPTLVAAVRSSRARTSALLAKASRLQEENLRLREAFKAVRREADRAERLKTGLEKCERRVRELECDRCRILQDMEGVQGRAKQAEEKARKHASSAAVEEALKDVEERERARCGRWRSTTWSLRALLESLRRHLQRGHHAAPSFTAFQLIEQLFQCLATQEADSCVPPRRPELEPTLPSPPQPLRKRGPVAVAVPDSGGGEKSEGSRREKTSPQARGGGDDEEKRRRARRGRKTAVSSMTDAIVISSSGSGSGSGSGAWEEGGGGKDSSSSGVSGSLGDFCLGGSEEEEEKEGGQEKVTRFPTEWAYRLAVTKLTAKLKASRERLREEKKVARSAGERADEEEQRCRQLELEVEAMSSKVSGAEAHRRRLEALLEEARRDRDILEQKQQSTASNLLNAALGIAQRQRGAPSCSSIPSPTFKSVTPTAATPAPSLETAASNRFQPPAGSVTTGTGGMKNNYGMPVSDSGRGRYPRNVAVDGTSGGVIGVGPRDSDFVPRRGGEYRAVGLPAQEAPARLQPQPPISNKSGGELFLPERRFGSGIMSRRTASTGVRAVPTHEKSQLGNRLERATGLASAAGTDSRNDGSRSVTSAADALGRRDVTWRSDRDRQGRGGGESRFGGGLVGPRPIVAGRGAAYAAGSRGSSWGLGPRTVTREDLTRLDDEIANLSKTVEQAALAQTRQTLRNVADSVERRSGKISGGIGGGVSGGIGNSSSISDRPRH